MKHILFPTDFSEAARHAFIYALKVADAIGGTITTLHVYQLPELRAAHLPKTIQDLYHIINLEEFENYKSVVPMLRDIAGENQCGHVPLYNVLKEGDATRTIVRGAREEASDLIIMGTKGAGWLKEKFLGTVAAEVMEHAPCPVLAVPKEASFDGVIDHIAITTNYMEKDVQAVKKLMEFAQVFDAAVSCLHVDTLGADSSVEQMEEWKAALRDIPNLSFEVIDGSDLFANLSVYLELSKIDIVAMLIEKRNFWEELVHYSKAKKMAYQSRVPVLSIPVHSL